jgi:hypothetical protein
LVPPSILEASIKITNEPPTGMQANLHKALDNFDQVTENGIEIFDQMSIKKFCIDNFDQVPVPICIDCIDQVPVPICIDCIDQVPVPICIDCIDQVPVLICIRF